VVVELEEDVCDWEYVWEDVVPGTPSLREEVVEDEFGALESMQSEDTTIRTRSPASIARLFFILPTGDSSSAPFYAFPKNHKN